MLERDNAKLQGRIRELVLDNNALRSGLHMEALRVSTLKRELEVWKGKSLRDDGRRSESP